MARLNKHSWKNASQKDRIILCLLKRSYDRKHIALIFNHIFRGQLMTEGLPNGLEISALDGQHQEIKKGGPGHKIYVRILQATQAEIEHQYQQHLTEIRQAIKALKLTIPFRSTPLSKPTRKLNIKQRTKRRRDHSMAATIVSNDSADSDAHADVRPQLQQYAYQRSPYFAGPTSKEDSSPRYLQVQHEIQDIAIRPTLNSTTDSTGKVVPTHPLLLFRAAQDITRFRSRRHTKQDVTIPAPPKFGSLGFRDEVWPHLQRDKAYPSPFISLAQNPHNALRRVEITKSEEVDKKVFLAVFAFNDVQADAQQKFGDGCGPYLVRSLFDAKEISDLPDGYKGSGEWLVYGSIDTDPIAVLDSAQAIGLAKALRHFKAGDISALLQISESLRGVPSKWKESTAYCLLRYYCGKSSLPQLDTQPYRLLMQVVFDSSEDSLAQLELHCQRAATINIKDSWAIIPDGNHPSVVDEEIGMSDSDKVIVVKKPSLRPTIQIPVSQHKQGFRPSEFVVERLNSLASKVSAVQQKSAPARQAGPTPMWSESESDDVPSLTAEARTKPLRSARNEVPQKRGNPIDDWDIVEDELDDDFTYEFPSAARKIRRRQVEVPGSQDIVPSVETDTTSGSFMSGLLYPAYNSPTPAPTSKKALLHTTKAKIHHSKGTSPAQDIPTVQIVATSSLNTLKNTLNSAKSVQSRDPNYIFYEQDSPSSGLDSDEDIVVVHRGRGRRVQIPFRSLSVQDYKDEEET